MRGDLDDAANNASFAESIEPWSSRASLQLAQVEELRGRLDEAARRADEAISESPGDWQNWYVAARIAREAGIVRPPTAPWSARTSSAPCRCPSRYQRRNSVLQSREAPGWAPID